MKKQKKLSIFSKVRRKFLRGFTLTEILITVGIILVLSAVGLFVSKEVMEKSGEGISEFEEELGSFSLQPYLLGHWSFNEGSGDIVYDSSGYGNDGAITKTHSWSDETYNKKGYALSFPSMGEVLIPDSPSLSITGENITVEAWVYISESQGGAEQTYYSVIRKFGHYNLVFGNPRFGYEGISWRDSITSNPMSIGFYGTVPRDEWAHLAVTFNGQELVFYINGDLVGIKERSGSLADNDNDLQLAKFTGMIDNVVIYTETLTISQIRDHYIEGLKKKKLTEEQF